MKKDRSVMPFEPNSSSSCNHRCPRRGAASLLCFLNSEPATSKTTPKALLLLLLLLAAAASVSCCLLPPLAAAAAAVAPDRHHRDVNDNVDGDDASS